jgi:hypothetical protein
MPAHPGEHGEPSMIIEAAEHLGASDLLIAGRHFNEAVLCA